MKQLQKLQFWRHQYYRILEFIFMYFKYLPLNACLTCLFFTSFLPAPSQSHFQSVASSISFPVAFFVFQMRKMNRFFAYVLLWIIMLDVVSSYGIAKILRTNDCFFFFFFPWVDFSIDQTKFIGWVQRIRAMSLQRRYNIFDIDNNSTIVNYDKWIITFLVSSFIDFNCFVQSEIILARILRD